DLASRLKQGDTVKLEYRRPPARDIKTASVVARRLSNGSGFSYSWSDGTGSGSGSGSGESPFVFRTFPPSTMIEPGELFQKLIVGGSDPWLNMETVSVNAELGEYFGTTKGLLVLRAPRDSSLSLRTGDVILAVDGRDVTSAAQMYRVLRSYDSGE